MRKTTKAIAIFLLLALALGLFGCSLLGVTATDAVQLVQGNLDGIYLGKYDASYLKLVDMTQAEGEEAYEAALRTEAEYFIGYYGIEYPTEALYGEIIELYRDIYAKADFTVSDAAKIDDKTFGVKVQVRPLDIFELLYENWDAYSADVFADYTDEQVAAMNEEEYQAYDALWAQTILSTCRALLPQMGTMEEQSLVVQVEQDSDGFWMIKDSDLSAIDALIIYYP